MTSPIRIGLLLVVAAWGIRPDAQAASQSVGRYSPTQRRLLEVAGDGFELRQTERFWIAYNTSPQLAYKLSRRVEGVYKAVERFCQDKGIRFQPPSEPLEVIYFDRPGQFHRYARQVKFPSRGTYGFYLDSNGRSAFFNLTTDPELRRLQKGIVAAQENLRQAEQFLEQIRRADQPVEIQYDDGRKEVISAAQATKQIHQTRRELDRLERRERSYRNYLNRAVIQHEITHQVLFQAGVHNRQARNPQWVVEGLATMFECSLNSLLRKRPAISYIRLDDLRHAVGGKDHLQKKLNYDDFRQAVESGELVSLKKLLTEPDLFQKRGHQVANTYALAWSVMYYLQRCHGGHLADYLQAIRQRPAGEDPGPEEELALFEQYFGPVGPEFEREFCRFIFRLRPIPLHE